MLKLLGALVAAISLAVAGSASATVIYTETGSSFAKDVTATLPVPGAGKYRVRIEADRTVQMQAEVVWTYQWATYVAPPPKPPSAWVDGALWEESASHVSTGTAFEWHFTIPRDYITYFEGYYDPPYGIPPGTLMYKEHTWRQIFLSMDADYEMGSDGQPPFTYTFTVTAVPEPATWAMMITGFGLAGAALRRRRRNTVATDQAAVRLLA